MDKNKWFPLYYCTPFIVFDCTGTEKCFKQCEGHSWEIAPYFEPSPNGISFCYTMEDPLIVCKEHPNQVTSKSTTTSPHDDKLSTVLYLDAGEADPDTKVNTNPGMEKHSAQVK